MICIDSLVFDGARTLNGAADCDCALLLFVLGRSEACSRLVICCVEASGSRRPCTLWRRSTLPQMQRDS
jgi:hypothetical protein